MSATKMRPRVWSKVLPFLLICAAQSQAAYVLSGTADIRCSPYGLPETIQSINTAGGISCSGPQGVSAIASFGGTDTSVQGYIAAGAATNTSIGGFSTGEANIDVTWTSLLLVTGGTGAANVLVNLNTGEGAPREYASCADGIRLNGVLALGCTSGAIPVAFGVPFTLSLRIVGRAMQCCDPTTGGYVYAEFSVAEGTLQAVPEPGSAVLVGAPMAVLALRRRRRSA